MYKYESNSATLSYRKIVFSTWHVEVPLQNLADNSRILYDVSKHKSSRFVVLAILLHSQVIKTQTVVQEELSMNQGRQRLIIA